MMAEESTGARTITTAPLSDNSSDTQHHVKNDLCASAFIANWVFKCMPPPLPFIFISFLSFQPTPQEKRGSVKQFQFKPEGHLSQDDF